MPNNVNWTPLIERALAEELGIRVTTNNVHAMRTYIGEFIRENPHFKEVSVCTPSVPNEVWLVRKSAEELL